MHDANNKGVSHAEGSVPVGHAGVGPTFGEALQLLELFGDKPSEASVYFDDVL